MFKRIILAGWLLMGLAVPVGLALVFSPPTSAQVFGTNQTITVVDSGTACVTAPTACATFALDAASGGVTISISGTWTGTLTFEGTNNDGVWTALSVTNLATGARVTTTTASGLFGVGNAGLIKVRVRATAAVTGSALVTAAKGLGQPSADFFSGGGSASGPIYAPDGTALLPAYSFASEPTLGFWRSGAAAMTLQGAMTATGNISAVNLGVAGQTYFSSPSAGFLTIQNGAFTIGVKLKVDALPTVASGFGTSPSVLAGSTPLAGGVDVGTGGVATGGVISFNGTAFPSAPFCAANASNTNVLIRMSPGTTSLTINANSAWAANDIVRWICISSK